MSQKKYFREVVSFFLLKQNRFLAEKRKKTKRIDPGLWTIPSGGIKKSEPLEQAVQREAKEELCIQIQKPEFLCTLLEKTPFGTIRCHYVIAKKWKGKIHSIEAEKVAWIPLSNTKKLGVYVDRQAMRIFKENQKKALHE